MQSQSSRGLAPCKVPAVPCPRAQRVAARGYEESKRFAMTRRRGVPLFLKRVTLHPESLRAFPTTTVKEPSRLGASECGLRSHLPRCLDPSKAVRHNLQLVAQTGYDGRILSHSECSDRTIVGGVRSDYQTPGTECDSRRKRSPWRMRIRRRSKCSHASLTYYHHS